MVPTVKMNADIVRGLVLSSNDNQVILIYLDGRPWRKVIDQEHFPGNAHWSMTTQGNIEIVFLCRRSIVKRNAPYSPVQSQEQDEYKLITHSYVVEAVQGKVV